MQTPSRTSGRANVQAPYPMDRRPVCWCSIVGAGGSDDLEPLMKSAGTAVPYSTGLLSTARAAGLQRFVAHQWGGHEPADFYYPTTLAPVMLSTVRTAWDACIGLLAAGETWEIYTGSFITSNVNSLDTSTARPIDNTGADDLAYLQAAFANLGIPNPVRIWLDAVANAPSSPAYPGGPSSADPTAWIFRWAKYAARLWAGSIGGRSIRCGIEPIPYTLDKSTPVPDVAAAHFPSIQTLAFARAYLSDGGQPIPAPMGEHHLVATAATPPPRLGGASAWTAAELAAWQRAGWIVGGDWSFNAADWAAWRGAVESVPISGS